MEVRHRMDSDNVFKVDVDGFVKISQKKMFNVETLTAISSLGGNILKQVYTDAHLSSRNFNKNFRTLVIGSMALIPYGGIFIAPQIGLLGPENVDPQKNQVKKRMEQLATRMDEKISEYDFNDLIKEVKVLMNILRPFEDLLNGKLHVSESYFSKGKMQKNNHTAVKCINDAFLKVIDQIQKDKQKEGKLPIFTIIATTHIQFLYFIEINRNHSKIQFNTEDFKQCIISDFKKTTEEYVDYIQKTYQMGRQKFIKKMQNIAKAEIGIYSLDEQEILNEMRMHYKQIFMNEATAASFAAKKKVVDLAIAINEYENLMFEKNLYYHETWGNEAFLEVAKL
ncbi:hypothetical protein GH866_29370 [Bacillus thuringiensis]|nr:hypothetical protein [Bacillus thuringiensis]